MHKPDYSASTHPSYTFVESACVTTVSPRLEDSTCDSCGHEWRWHTRGGMCQGTAAGIECHCSRMGGFSESES